MKESWKSFWFGTLAAISIALLAGVFLNNSNQSSGEKFSSSSTRIGR